MKQVDLIKLASPEWSPLLEEAGIRCSQYGAYLAFSADGKGQFSLFFDDDYPVMTWTLSVDGQDKEDLEVTGRELTFFLEAGRHDYQLTLNQWATGQVAFWQTGLTIMEARYMGEGDLTASLPNEKQQAANPYLTFVGDSIVAGEAMAGLNHDRHRPTQSFPALVARARNKPLNRIAYGGTGLTTSAPFQEPKAIDALWRVGEDLPRRRVQSDQVVVAYGLNDANYGASEDDFAFGLRVYLLELVKRFHQAHFYVLTPWNGKFSAIFKKEAARFDCFTIVDTTDWGIQTRPHHPGIEDHEKIAKKLISIL
ncbi:GDSL-type esterase/lipase family protein [Fructobacillus sp. M1-13]|uniref:Lysophospholipase n=1 Tax=Fructobacillus papyriferae TaxID=2713171 RepID=A0ABS5QQ65_9LACO|nr:GDSL-type esterase/lipase family protein [Fructobacillus papyriferae]MBS9334546.1 lysophospholipase [Fructobacillus papyriferae]MCD2158535.1 GDSL-type esterase/lipase family protein [Fructobacillus papyriferae]